MLSGMYDGAGGSMFPRMTVGNPAETPSPEDIEKARQAVMFDKVVKLKRVNVKTYDLSKPEEVKAYTKDRKAVMEGMQRNEIAVLFSDRRFVPAIPGYLAHMEWVEFKLTAKAVTPVAGSV